MKENWGSYLFNFYFLTGFVLLCYKDTQPSYMFLIYLLLRTNTHPKITITLWLYLVLIFSSVKSSSFLPFCLCFFFWSYFILKLYKLSWRESRDTDEKAISKNKGLMRRINKIEWKESNLTFIWDPLANKTFIYQTVMGQQWSPNLY